MTDMITDVPECAKNVAQINVTFSDGAETVGLCYMFDPDSDQRIADTMERSHSLECGVIMLDFDGEHCGPSTGWDLFQNEDDRFGIQLWGPVSLDPDDAEVCAQLVEEYLFAAGVLERTDGDQIAFDRAEVKRAARQNKRQKYLH
jgi:hypothetical protein